MYIQIVAPSLVSADTVSLEELLSHSTGSPRPVLPVTTRELNGGWRDEVRLWFLELQRAYLNCANKLNPFGPCLNR